MTEAQQIPRRELRTYFRDRAPELLPEWLEAGEGLPTWWTVGLVIDAQLDKAYQGTYARFPTYAPPDALRYVSRDRLIVRGPNEPPDVFAARALRWLDDHRLRGGPWALMEQLRGYMFPANVRIRTVDDRGNWFTIARDGTRSYVLNSGTWNWDSPVGRKTRFWVIVYPEEIAPGRFIPWGNDPVWGASASRIWGDRALTWGTTATPAEVATVRQIIRTWKPAGTSCKNIIIAYDDSSFDPSSPEPDGDWNLWGTGGNGPRTSNRLSTARYWRGTGD
jgi:hypothetical protein